MKSQRAQGVLFALFFEAEAHAECRGSALRRSNLTETPHIVISERFRETAKYSHKHINKAPHCRDMRMWNVADRCGPKRK